jgi:hypothetical protein
MLDGHAHQGRAGVYSPSRPLINDPTLYSRIPARWLCVSWRCQLCVCLAHGML